MAVDRLSDPARPARADPNKHKTQIQNVRAAKQARNIKRRKLKADALVAAGWGGGLSTESPQATGRVAAVMRGAASEGLTIAKDGRIAGRVSAELIAAAKERTGLQSDTELIAYALANVALEDNFSNVFRAVKSTVDPDLDLGF